MKDLLHGSVVILALYVSSQDEVFAETGSVIDFGGATKKEQGSSYLDMNHSSVKNESVRKQKIGKEKVKQEPVESSPGAASNTPITARTSRLSTSKYAKKRKLMSPETDDAPHAKVSLCVIRSIVCVTSISHLDDCSPPWVARFVNYFNRG